mmetsp:Transcript_4395/g.17282  ORF Transcript_4395/g.17282 Transcript_4395/m.17282 type:complete len:246 (+) Transcript_4395:594-1331(+)
MSVLTRSNLPASTSAANRSGSSADSMLGASFAKLLSRCQSKAIPESSCGSGAAELRFFRGLPLRFGRGVTRTSRSSSTSTSTFKSVLNFSAYFSRRSSDPRSFRGRPRLRLPDAVLSTCPSPFLSAATLSASGSEGSSGSRCFLGLPRRRLPGPCAFAVLLAFLGAVSAESRASARGLFRDVLTALPPFFASSASTSQLRTTQRSAWLAMVLVGKLWPQTGHCVSRMVYLDGICARKGRARATDA